MHGRGCARGLLPGCPAGELMPLRPPSPPPPPATWRQFAELAVELPWLAGKTLLFSLIAYFG